MTNRLTNTLSWLVTILVPIALVLLGVRLLLNPQFPQFEYGTPNFPDDPYGFTLEERLKWAQLSVEYLINDAGIEFLGDLRFDDGTPVFNQRELKHMLDVKVLVGIVLKVWMAVLSLLALLGLWAWRSGWLPAYRHGFRRGGWWTVGFVGLVVVFALLSFNIFFTAFHRVFFEGDTWLFLFSDTLIRLFPVRFWQDAFLYIGGLALALGFSLVILLKPSRS